MKKLFVLLTVMVAIVGFNSAAFAQCSSCKGPVRGIYCDVAGEQAEAVSCLEFDYDLNVPLSDGYCPWSLPIDYAMPYKAILDICSCEDPNLIFNEDDIGIRMEILVNGQSGSKGVSWSGTGAVTDVDFDMFPTHKDACDATAFAGANTFGPLTYYDSEGGVIAAESLPADSDCTFSGSTPSTVLATSSPGFDVTGITDGFWWIDIPPIRIDRSVLNNGEVISVKICLIDLPCKTCILCTCTIPVAKVCCTSDLAGSSMTFPYFTSLTTGNWWNGIAIVNKSSAAGTATLTAYEQDGSVGTATVDVAAKSMFVSLLQNISWTGAGLGGSPCYIEVSYDFGDADGFAMMGTGNEANGYLPRIPYLPN